MANLDGAFGLQPLDSPFGNVKTIERDLTAAAGAVYINSPVQAVAAGTISIAAAGGVLCGSAVGFRDSAGVPQNYYPGGSLTGWKVTIAHDPEQEFMIQDDGDTTQVAAADVFNTANIVNPTAGSTVTGISAAELDSSSAATASAATDQLRILGLIEKPDNAIGAYAKWRVKINRHQFTDNIAGV